MSTSFPAKWAVGMFEKRFSKMVKQGTATVSEKKDQWLFFTKELVKDGTITPHQRSVWFNPYS